jgi:pullulanase/glycogen debranching enzyme
VVVDFDQLHGLAVILDMVYDHGAAIASMDSASELITLRWRKPPLLLL